MFMAPEPDADEEAAARATAIRRGTREGRIDPSKAGEVRDKALTRLTADRRDSGDVPVGVESSSKKDDERVENIVCVDAGISRPGIREELATDY